MMVFFLVLSFLLNAVTIFCLILLYMRQNRTLQAEEQYENMIKEIEDVFALYMVEMKEENENFLRKVRKQAIQEERHENEKLDVVPETQHDEMIDEGQQDLQVNAYTKLSARTVYQATKELEQDMGDDVPEDAPLMKKVLFLQKKGFKLEEIAQQLNKGKTEIELLLKFSENKT